MTNHYAILGLGMQASSEEVKSAYRQKARRVHPDAGHKEARDFHAVQTAYQVLIEPKKRAAYDRELATWLQGTGKLLCAGCGIANQVPSIPTGFRPICGRCGVPLLIDEPQRRSAARTALVVQAVCFAEELGGEVLAVAKDAAIEGLAHLRNKFRIPKHGRRV